MCKCGSSYFHIDSHLSPQPSVDGRAHDEVDDLYHLVRLEELELGAFEAPSGHRPQQSPTLQHRHAMLLYDMVWYMYGNSLDFGTGASQIKLKVKCLLFSCRYR